MCSNAVQGDAPSITQSINLPRHAEIQSVLLIQGLENAWDILYLVSSRRCVIRSFRSLAFFKPPNAILVPGMYFFGFSRYSNCSYHQRNVQMLVFPNLYRKALQDEQTYQRWFVPCNTLLFVCVGIGISLNLASLSTEQAMEVWSDLIAFTFLQGVALCTSRL